MAVPVTSQDLSEHLWTDRVFVVYTEDYKSELYKQQIDELLGDEQGLAERKLFIYSITPTHLKTGWDNENWEIRDNFMDDIPGSNEDFVVILIGLDGTVKLRQDYLLTRQKLYSKIDSMPMRRRELKNQD